MARLGQTLLAPSPLPKFLFYFFLSFFFKFFFFFSSLSLSLFLFYSFLSFFFLPPLDAVATHSAIWPFGALAVHRFSFVLFFFLFERFSSFSSFPPSLESLRTKENDAAEMESRFAVY